MEVTLRAVGGHGDDVNKGRNKARSALEQSSSLSHGGWTVMRTHSGERLGCEWEQEGEARGQIQRRDEEAPPTVASVRMEKTNHPDRQVGQWGQGGLRERISESSSGTGKRHNENIARQTPRAALPLRICSLRA